MSAATYDIRTVLWFRGRTWALFHERGARATCVFTGRTDRACTDFLRTAHHQRTLPKGAVRITRRPHDVQL